MPFRDSQDQEPYQKHIHLAIIQRANHTKASTTYFVEPSWTQNITGGKKNTNGSQVDRWLIRKKRVGLDSMISLCE